MPRFGTLSASWRKNEEIVAARRIALVATCLLHGGLVVAVLLAPMEYSVSLPDPVSAMEVFAVPADRPKPSQPVRLAIAPVATEISAADRSPDTMPMAPVESDGGAPEESVSPGGATGGISDPFAGVAPTEEVPAALGRTTPTLPPEPNDPEAMASLRSELALLLDPKAAGDIELLVKIDPEGTVLEVRNLRGELAAVAIARLAERVVGRRLFGASASSEPRWRLVSVGTVEKSASKTDGPTSGRAAERRRHA